MTPQKEVDPLDEIDQNSLITYQKLTSALLEPQFLNDLLSISPIRTHADGLKYQQEADEGFYQSSGFSQYSSTNDTLKHRPRKTLTKDLIHQLNEAFQLYEQQPSCSRYCLTDLANDFRIGYSTILRKYKEFRSNSYIQEGKRLTAYPKSYKKRRLAHVVVSRSLAERSSFESVKEIAKYVMSKYGLYYTPQVVRRQLRTIGITRNQRREIVKKNRQVQCDRCLLRSLMEINSNIVYFSQSKVSFLNKEKGNIALLSSSFGSKIAVLVNEIEWECILTLKKGFQGHFSTEINQIWYLVIDESTTYQNYLCRCQQTTNPHDYQQKKCKIINIASSSHFTTPGDHLLNEIISTINTTDLSLSEAISTLPRWLEAQQATTNTFIKQAESYLTSSSHTCPA